MDEEEQRIVARIYRLLFDPDSNPTRDEWELAHFIIFKMLKAGKFATC